MSKKKETKEERSERRRKELRLALRVFRYFLPYKWAMVVALLASAVVSGTTAGTAWLIKPALDDIFIRQDGTALLYVPLAFIVLTALKGAGRYLQNWCMHYSALHVLETMRQELFQKIITLPLHFYEESQVGALMSRVINDVGMIRQSLPAFIQIIRQVITMISLLYVVFQQNFELACWAIIVLPVAGFPLSLFSRALRRYGRKNAEVNASISSMLQELLSGIRVIKALSKTDYERQRFRNVNGELTDVEEKAGRITSITNPAATLVLNLGLTLVVVAGAYRVNSGGCKSGVIVAFLQYFTMILNALLGVTRIFIMFSKGQASANRVADVLNLPPDLEVLPAEKCEETGNHIEFRDVSFSYTGKGDHLEHVSFALKHGGCLGILGPTGAGKSTLVNLLLRLYDRREGEILLDGRDVRTIPTEELRKKFGVVFQNDFVMRGTIGENISFFRGLPEEDLTHAAGAAQAGFIAEKEGGMAAEVTARGNNLSGGQKQRLLIARALAGKPDILVLDDASSALDYRTDANLRHALSRAYAGVTTIIVGQFPAPCG